jgi:type I restriction enzyme S subunit
LYYLLISTRGNWDRFEAEGSVFGAVTKSDVNEFVIIIPPLTLQGKFDSLAEPLDTRIRLNEEESRNLSEIRDSLLPKLMSGKIGVPVEVR